MIPAASPSARPKLESQAGLNDRKMDDRKMGKPGNRNFLSSVFLSTA
jgi:hypothetical protein